MKTTNGKMNVLGSMLAVVAMGAIVGTMQASAGVVTNPSGLSTDINENGETMVSTAGNLSIAEFNALPGQQTLTFETADGYGSIASGPNTVNIGTFSIQMERTGGNFGPIVGSNGTPTGGSENIAYGANNGAARFAFNQDVYGVAFTVNSLDNGTLTIGIWSDTNATVQIGSNYTLSNGDNSENSFFGVWGQTAIRALTFASDGGQFQVDDFSFTQTGAVVPEPNSLALLLLGLAGLRLAKTRIMRKG